MSQKKPNLIYMFADQLRLCSMGYYGDKKAITPNIDALSHDSCNLINAVSGHPVCAPYRASLFTGKYTTSTGMVINEIRLNTVPSRMCLTTKATTPRISASGICTQISSDTTRTRRTPTYQREETVSASTDFSRRTTSITKTTARRHITT